MKSDNNLKAALSALEGSKSKELTDIGIVEAANKLFSERHLNSLVRESHPTLRRAQLRGMVECATLAKNLIDGYLSPQPAAPHRYVRSGPPVQMQDVLLACGELNERERVAVRWVLDKINELPAQPKEQRAEPVDEERLFDCIGAWLITARPDLHIPAYAEVIRSLVHRIKNLVPSAPSAREKAMEEAGDAMDELLDGPWHIYDENREKAISVWRAAKSTK